MNIGQLIDKTSKKYPSKTFLRFGKQEISYSSLANMVRALSSSLSKFGVQAGDYVAILLPNSTEFIYSWLSLVSIGAVVVPINTGYKAEEFENVLNHARCSTIITNSSLFTSLASIRTRCPYLTKIISTDRSLRDAFFFGDMMGSPSDWSFDLSFEDDAPACVNYTSGTTGSPKGVVQAHRTYLLTAEAFPYWLGLNENDRLFTCLPLFHMNAQAYTMMGCLGVGATMILVDRFSASHFWEQIEESDATEFNFIGAMMMILYKQSTEERRYHRVKISYGVPAIPEEIKKEIEQRFSIRIITGYGLTESTFGTIEPLEGPRKPGSIGKPRQHPTLGNINEVRIVNEDLQELPAGAVGEIILRNPAIFKGYLNDPEQTSKVVRDGWLHTGDLGYRDSDDFFYFVDRMKDIIRRRGENISSLEIEGAILQNPKVLQCAVIAVPSDLLDDEIKAYVVPKPDVQLTHQEVVDWCTAKLADFKVPRFIEFRQALPQTQTQRVAKYALRATASSEEKRLV
jgi:crotonobetaine/carnitine-CoA ligase